MTTVTDRIEKKILIRAPRARVWRALTDSKEFGTWFGIKFDGPFVVGAPARGVMTPTTVDPEVGKMQEPHAGHPFDITIDRMEPERVFGFRWHPFAIEPGVDYSAEPTTLILFTLDDAPGGTMVTVTESGFDGIPLERRAKAFTANEGGWSKMIHVLDAYATAHGA
jgi:uncharacterized protein YndB with AHSA1/START domain